MIGVDIHEFWLMQPHDLEPFNKAFLLSMEEKDLMNWQLGQYMQLAVGSVLTPKSIKYPNEPMLYNKLGREREEQQQMDYEVGKRNNLIVRQRLMQRIRNRKKFSGGE